MSQTVSLERQTAEDHDPITRWLFLVAALIVIMVVVGGFVRLSRAGLSIVEWDVVTGVVPPIGETAWQESFAEYQQTPEYQLVNEGMTLGDYQRIFYYEWAHRLIGRIAGFLVIGPLVWFMWKRRLSLRESIRYWAVVALFGVQGAVGWVMVASGLKDRPVVSHFRLTIHLLMAVLLLGIVLWMALDRIRAADRTAATGTPMGTGTRRLSWTLMAALLLQLSYGGLVAGLKAGHVSDTWPLMFGRLIPSGLLSGYSPWWRNLYEALASHWIHRWFAFVVAGIAVALYLRIRRERTGWIAPRAANWLLLAVGGQITLGILVVLLGVPKWFAVAHQGLGIILFSIVVVLAHQAYAERSSTLQPQPVT